MTLFRPRPASARSPVPRAPRRGLRAGLAAAGLALLAACAGPDAPSDARLPEGTRVVELPSGRALDGLPALAARAREADLLVVGEVHDNPSHQELQVVLARTLGIRALALEMVPQAAEPALAELRAAAPDPETRAAPETESLRAAADWDDYAPWHGVIEAVPQAQVTGGGVPRADLRQAMTEGAAAAFGADAARYGLDAPLPAGEQGALEAELDASHCGALPAEMLAPMVEAQRLRDARFAQALLRARQGAGAGAGASAGPARAMLVTGNGHARRDRGAPFVLTFAAPELRVLSILQAEWSPDAPGDVAAALAPWRRADGGLPYDLAVIAPAPGREDPCARFRKQG
ncbi:ChaN family lipoprotein [uncultured Albimonas sp.]|uniref:ChaN family lipoprotein n=1 Tax=uncultured Albimonas sp. TaxID=1331701 RepID=UPI0030ED2311|tara:strand:- start:743 stop:1780 length:1038 start_codon:yes stop_codon:yes gene_type:complete